MLSTFFLILSVFYAGVILFFALGIIREKNRSRVHNGWSPSVTVIIPARNESRNIQACLQGLAAQTYPREKLQILVVDDHSSDNTSETVRCFIEKERLEHFRLLIHTRDGIKPTYKKAAITYAMKFATGEVIFTIDADCVPRPRWIAHTLHQYQPDTGMVPGLVTFDPKYEENLFHKLQTLEFAGLVFAGVGAVGNRYPLICNGANLSYRRSAFDAVGGFSGHDHLPSGDDDLLMQNIHRFTQWKVHYNLDSETLNYTHPVKGLKEFYHQRARWASKGIHYPGISKFLFLFTIYLFYLSIVVFSGLALAGKFSFGMLLTGVLCKWVPEFLIIVPALQTLKRMDLLRWFIPAQIIHVPYIVISGFAGFFKLFNWKG